MIDLSKNVLKKNTTAIDLSKNVPKNNTDAAPATYNEMIQNTSTTIQSETTLNVPKYNTTKVFIGIIIVVILIAGYLGNKYLSIRQSTPQPPETWSVTADKLFTRDGVPQNQSIAKLVTALESNKGEGAPVSKQEFMAMLSRPEAQTIYYKEIMKYATPASLELQKKEHEDYAKIFMREEYQKAGLEFLTKQREQLERAEREYGVLQRDIVSLLIWESGLGKFTGDYREVNVFLGQMLFLDKAQEIALKNIVAEGKPNPFDDSAQAQKERKRLDRRKAQAIENMAALLRFCKKSGFDPFDIKGSWGGAIGNVQFMPANLKYAVDGDRDGKLDLTQWPDAIMSAANFLKIRGKYDLTEAGRKRALLRYNPSSEYVDGVMLLAETIWKRHLNGE